MSPARDPRYSELRLFEMRLSRPTNGLSIRSSPGTPTSTYGADYPVESLVRKISDDPSDEESDIFIPDFQRGFVWTKPQSDRFIESLLLGLPVPGIFLWKDPQSGRLAVIDGLQRLRTLKFYYDGIIRGKEFALDGVHPDFRENL